LDYDAKAFEKDASTLGAQGNSTGMVEVGRCRLPVSVPVILSALETII
jgi:hypothetical protein